MSSATPDRKRGHGAEFGRVAGLCALLAALAATAASAAPGAGDLEKNQQQLDQVHSRIENLKSQLQRDRGQKDAATEALEAAERRVAEAQAGLRRARADVAAQKERIRANQARQAEATAELEREKVALARQVRAAYVMGNRARTQLWLSQSDTASLGRVIAEYDWVNRARAQQVGAVHARMDELAALQTQLDEERARLEALERDQTQALAALEQGRNERRGAVAQLDRRISSSQGELKSAEADEQQLKKLLEQLRRALAEVPGDFDRNGTPFAQQKGRLPWPLRGAVIADYGSAKSDARLTWSGRWIAAPEGASVRAIARGRAAYVGWLQRYGLIVILEHGGGYFTLYGHLSSSAPTAGQWVEAGEAVGAAGDTGGHDRSGVYLELRKGSTALDPREWLGK